MARLTRKNIKVFAGDASNNGVFGSLQANNPVLTNDVEQLQSLSAWGEGWNAATETSEDLPPLEEIQGVEYVTTYQQAYIMQEGIPEWAATVTYYKGCLAKEVTSTGFRIYNSLSDDNTGNLLSDTLNWKKVMDSDDLYAFDSTVVHKANAETITGEKTFSVSPIVPTATSGDSSTKAASTAFVTTVSSNLQTQINQKANASDVVNLTGSQTISGQKTFTDKVEIQGANGHILFHIPGTMYTRLQESSNGLEVRTGDGVSLATLFAGWSDANNSVVVTAAKSKSSNGGFKLSNGLIVNWGTVSGSGGTVSYSIPFSGTNYGISMTRISANGTNDNDAITAVTSTNFSATIYQGGGARWVAIGY